MVSIVRGAATMEKKLISIVTPCYNEEVNVENLYKKVKEVCEKHLNYEFEHIFIDNCSQDRTVEILKELAKNDPKLKIIVNARNFGHIRSPFYGILQAHGDAVVLLVCDLQDPPEMLSEFIKKWEEGKKIIVGVKQRSLENPLFFALRRFYYFLLASISDVHQIKNFTGFGFYDKSFIDVLRSLPEPYPYFRGLVAELGFSVCEIEYTQPKRAKGKSKNNFFTLYDMAMTGFVNHSKVPLRLASFVGFAIALLSLVIAIVFFVYKLLFWNSFQLGMAPLIIGLFFFSSIQLFFIGILGEYIGAIFVQVKNRPLVIEKERVNF